MSEHKYEDKFLGPNRIKLTRPAGKTRNDSELIEVVYVDGKSEIWAKAMLDSEGVLTSEATDLTHLRTVRAFPVVREILEILLAYNLRFSEVQHTLQLAATSFNQNLDKADKFLWNTEYLEERTMNEIDQVLAKTEPQTVKDVIGG